jgi:hypothetical protein
VETTGRWLTGHSDACSASPWPCTLLSMPLGAVSASTGVVSPLRPHSLSRLKPSTLGSNDIDDDDIVAGRPGLVISFLAVGRRIDRKASSSRPRFRARTMGL